MSTLGSLQGFYWCLNLKLIVKYAHYGKLSSTQVIDSRTELFT